ncbi:MAG: hypothetical protein LBT09_15765 [Planctomycetaceae bacterium]|jgi:hypothetical protein|nr:hypothetical protein [Planctomycetaceae bacterium]
MSTLEKEDVPTNETCKEAHYEHPQSQYDPLADPRLYEIALQHAIFQRDYQKAMMAFKDEGIVETMEKWQADRIETARKLKLLGVDCEIIAQVIDLSSDGIEHYKLTSGVTSPLKKEDLPTMETYKEAHREYKRLQADPLASPKVVDIARQRFMFQLDHQMGKKALKDEGIAETTEKWQADKIETARKLKLRGVDCEKIAQAMGLSIDDVEQLN